ncbi:UbiH/UbiF/VisC/COQ6 family ubiquinone biosynthesis hydroxylase [Marinobacterium marinum]|uniref:UbiH/UbiF/VisC/COQ6 family ubiquinone biosynthesis hydroxylase n=1 Tax=Marinobacterium marinum TaxID=2756129 RepID=A0A7W2ABM8_9GAMM|nr:UbiH/UbiF/VisC/COQ6 family ubiquinone biosynthesis hydroxylase [Marinobacterium marinum]MBA4501614.1 UbiH/UbiF/VisC/COQ6 family ubiquinone biosynthesis hydroxylase [Marinobacterium marinum]
MTSEWQADLVIVGAGMVGLSLALSLAPAGRRIIVLEQRSGEVSDWLEQITERPGSQYDARVSALNPASVQLLEQLGAWSTIIGSGRARAYHDMEVWDGEGGGRIHFSADALHEDCLGHIVENSVVQGGLLRQVARHDNLTLLSGISLQKLSAPLAAGERTLTLSDGRELTAALVVGADGALSRTRQLSGLGATEWDYGHHALVTTITTVRPHGETCWQRFTEDGPLALLPLAGGNGRTSSIVWSTSPEHARALMALSDEAFRQALARAAEYCLGEVVDSAERHLIPLRQRHAHQYVDTGLALVGDAAHTIHPLAGQGVNLGLMDAAALADVVEAAWQRNESIADLQVLRRYQRQRRSANLCMSAAMEGFRRLFAPRSAPVRLLRSCGMNLMDRLEPVKQHLVLQAMGLSGDRPRRLQRRPLTDG